jgi:phosphohistidine phosphatase
MKNLILIRHAKSSWKFDLKDIDRPLNEIGIFKANTISKKTISLISDQHYIYTSNANRALSTCYIFVKNWKLDLNKINIIDSLYTFDSNNLEKVIKKTDNHINKMIVFGHNSAITDFVNKFGDIFIDNVPTSGLVSIIFESDNWATIKNGKTDNIIFPRDL